MNAAADLIERCHLQGISLAPRADMLAVKPANKLTAELRQALLRHKPDILAALAHEDATDYVAERSAIREADGLRPCGIRPVYEYRLADDPRQPLIMLGLVGQTLEQARASIMDRFGSARVLSCEPYQWPPMPERLQ